MKKFSSKNRIKSFKAIFFILIGVSLVFSCQKEEILSKDTTSNHELDSNQRDQKQDNYNQKDDGGDELCECTGFHLAQDETGSYSCPPPDDDCSKIQPCPCDPIVSRGFTKPGKNISDISQLFNERNFKLFRKSLKNKDLRAFFGSKNWQGVFSSLEEKPELLDDLKSGDKTIIEKVQGDKVYYLVVKASIVNSSVIQDSDVLMALEVPVTAL